MKETVMATDEKTMAFAYMNDVLFDRWDATHDDYGDGPPYRFCGQCGEKMAEGYVCEADGDTLCSDACLSAAEWMVDGEKVTPALIDSWFSQPDGGDSAGIYWTDWDGRN